MEERRERKGLSKEEANGARWRKGKGPIRSPPSRCPPQWHGGPFASAVACDILTPSPLFSSSQRFEDCGKRIPGERDYS